MSVTDDQMNHTGGIAIVGGGPAGLVAAIALARRGVRTTVFERDLHPEAAPRFNPDRSYTIDITGHGLRALRSIDATSYFDDRLLRFRGIQHNGKVMEDWSEPGWMGSRGDITRALMAVIEDRHEKDMDWEFQTNVTDVNVHDGTVTYDSPFGSATRSFDLVVGSDGAGSAVRQAMQEQVDGFTTETKSIPTYVTMIELDRVGDQLDKNYLHALSIRHFYAAGAINGDRGPESPRWFCAIGSKEELSFSSSDDARDLLAKTCPRVLELASDDAVEAFANRPCFHVGRSLTCSQLHGGRGVLIGDAAGPFPPIGQGLNAAMESATVLDTCIGAAGADLPAAAARYNAEWKPEADAVSWISQRFLFDDPLNTLRSMLTMKLGVNIADQAKSSEVPYSEVRRKGEKRGPLWR